MICNVPQKHGKNTLLYKSVFAIFVALIQHSILILHCAV